MEPGAQRAVLDDTTLRALQRRCWASAGAERGAAGFALRTLLRWRRDEQLADVEAQAATLAEIDEDLAARAVRQHVSEMAEGFAFPQTSHLHDGVRTFVYVVGKMASDALAEAVAALDPKVVEANWEHWLRSGGEAGRAVAAVLDVAVENAGPVGDMARRLRRGFPRASVPEEWGEPPGG